MDTQAKKVLIVDDEVDIVDTLTQIITSWCNDRFMFEINSCHDGIMACDWISYKKFDLVIIDQMMPRMRGDEVIAKIRDSSGPNQHTPIIMVSGMLSTVEGNFEDKDFDKVYFVQKPFSIEKIQRILNIFLHAG